MSSAEKSVPDDVPELSGSTYYPPPPPGLPPAAQSQIRNPTTPTVGEGQQQQPPPQEQHRIQYDQHISHGHGSQYQQHQTSPSGHYPAQSQLGKQEQPHFPPPPTKYDEKQPSASQVNPGQNTLSSIPAYNPADTAFTAPSIQPGIGASNAQSTTIGQSSPALPEQPSLHQQYQSEAEHEHKKGSWGGRFKSMLSAGAATPINSLAHKLGSQSFLPESLDKECDKAASILRAFCTKGVYADPGSGQPPTSTDPKAKESSSGLVDPTKEKPKNRVIVTIPPKVICKAAGLAIFTTLRAGFQVSGATGSGVLIARLPDGSWAPPSGISIHSLGGGFQIGLDIYDCVCVINSKEALSAFTNTRVSLGSDLAVAAGPYGAGAAVDFGTAVKRGRDDSKKQTVTAEHTAPHQATAPGFSRPEDQLLRPSGGDSKRRSLSTSAFKPVFSYVKSRGFYAGIQVDGTVVVERKDANSAFYGAPIPVQQILQGHVPRQGPKNMWPVGAHALMETLKGVEAGALDTHSLQPENNPQTPYAAMSGAISAPSTFASPPNSTSQGTVGSDPNNPKPSESSSLGSYPGLGHHFPADSASGAPPAYVDDGRHAHVSDVKYA